MTERVAPPSLRGLRGQPHALAAFAAALASGRRVAPSYLLHGPEGVGRARGALGFATALLCDDVHDTLPCGHCRGCAWNAAGNHPDLVIASAETGPFYKDDSDAGRAAAADFTLSARAATKPRARRSLKVQVLRRMLDLLSLSAVGGGRKIVVIDALDEVEDAGRATLLKVLEEPPPETTFLLLACGLDDVPDTIVSRSQRVRFQPLSPDVVREIVGENLDAEAPPEPDVLARAVSFAQGSVGRALRALDSGLAAEGPRLAAALVGTAGIGSAEAGGDGEPGGGVGPALRFVAAAGRDLAAQRLRARDLVALALQEARDAATAGTGAPRRSTASAALEHVVPALATALQSLSSNVSPELALRALAARLARARRLPI